MHKFKILCLNKYEGCSLEVKLTRSYQVVIFNNNKNISMETSWTVSYYHVFQYNVKLIRFIHNLYIYIFIYLYIYIFIYLYIYIYNIYIIQNFPIFQFFVQHSIIFISDHRKLILLPLMMNLITNIILALTSLQEFYILSGG